LYRAHNAVIAWWSKARPPCSVLRKELEDRLAAAGHAFEWADIVQDLERLSETEIEQDGKRYILRNAAPGCAGTVLRTLGIALPPLVRSAQPPPPPPPRQKPRRRPRRRSANARTATANTLIRKSYPELAVEDP
jgi:hypothetical protein